MNDLFLPTLTEPPGVVTRYERAVYWLGEAVRVDEVMTIRDEAERLKLAGRQASDRSLQANAAELQMRAERKLGAILIAARESGQISSNRPRKFDFSRVTLESAGITRKLSSKAQDLARSDPDLFERIIAEARLKIEAGRAVIIDPLKATNTAEKQLRRRIKEAQLAQRQRALPDKVYGVILADPEWKFETWSEAGMDRSADNHYPTSELATIKARPVATIAAADCTLFLWATAPMLLQALDVLRFWGFAYITHVVWDKIDEGTGYWFRNRHEILLVGKRGTPPAPAMGTQYPSVMAERPTVHSAKPNWAHEMIEAYFPNLPKIELNARASRPGWDAWGLEAPEQNSPDGNSQHSTGEAGGESIAIGAPLAPFGGRPSREEARGSPNSIRDGYAIDEAISPSIAPTR